MATGFGSDAPDLQTWLEDIEECERRIGYIFEDKELLRTAMTHASGADQRVTSNERMEFFGDTILGMVVCEYLYDEYPKLLEGDLTKIKSSVVSRQTCAMASESLRLDEFMIVGKGVANSANVPPSLLADVFESLTAAIYLDGGYEMAQRFVIEQMYEEIHRLGEGDSSDNFKSLLQQIAQRQLNQTPVYRLMDEKGPDHSKCFMIAAQVGKTRFQGAWGQNKKEAEQRAASNALAQLRNEEPPYPGE